MHSKITKIAQIYEERSQAWVDQYECPGINGDNVKVSVPREDREPRVLLKHLLRGGAALPVLDHCRSDLLLASNADAFLIYRAASTGWRNDGRHFVNHSFVAGIEDGSIVPPAFSTLGVVGNLGHRGTIIDWKKLIKIAQHSTAMTIALTAAFAAPLLSILQRPPFGLVYVAPSRSGKSSAQLVGSSVIGFGEEEHLPTLNATPSGLLETGLLFNDHLLSINEIGTAKGRKNDIHAVLRDTTYALMSGRDVTRHSSWNGSGSTGGSFKVILLLSSERSPD